MLDAVRVLGILAVAVHEQVKEELGIVQEVLCTVLHRAAQVTGARVQQRCKRALLEVAAATREWTKSTNQYQQHNLVSLNGRG